MPTDAATAQPDRADLDAVAGEARRLRRLGMSPRSIAAALGISRAAVDRATGDADGYRPGHVRVARYAG